ncbi:signal recognition particle subunit SRP14, putative [Plasmodium ovale]|uniref:Signal recognition particle 14 kDa protein n=1 Tax=Plasmodium ovale TaxID=36330 RepID=A0A1D3TLX0_PLAOA|nr:signal recognition particle subunit SRP14, putative [Plasmodium ovale]
MVLLSNSAFIEELRKLCTREDENKKASVWITMKRVKRSMIKKMVPKKEGSEKRNDRRNKKMNRDDGKVCKKYVCLIRATDGKIKISTHVLDNAINFSQEINNIMKS